MKIHLAIEWFLNPDHLPFIVAVREGIFARYGIDCDLIEPDDHYDGLSELLAGNIEFATNEPLHLIEQFDKNFLSLGQFFQTQGGVLLKASSYDKLLHGESITVTTPVVNETTNAIGFEIIRRFYAQKGVEVTRNQVHFVANGFEHLRYMKEGADAGWLYFYNFEGVGAQHEGMDVLYLDADNVGFANFSALHIFTTKTFYHTHTALCSDVILALHEAILFITASPQRAMEHYYAYTLTPPSPLMDDIIHATIHCFDPLFRSSYDQALPILDFFTEIGVTTLDKEPFKTAFLA